MVFYEKNRSTRNYGLLVDTEGVDWNQNAVIELPTLTPYFHSLW